MVWRTWNGFVWRIVSRKITSVYWSIARRWKRQIPGPYLSSSVGPVPENIAMYLTGCRCRSHRESCQTSALPAGTMRVAAGLVETAIAFLGTSLWKQMVAVASGRGKSNESNRICPWCLV